MTMTATNHDDQLGEIYPTMLNELNCTLGASFSRFHCCGRHGHGLWPSLFMTVVVCRRHGLWLSWYTCPSRGGKGGKVFPGPRRLGGPAIVQNTEKGGVPDGFFLTSK